MWRFSDMRTYWKRISLLPLALVALGVSLAGATAGQPPPGPVATQIAGGELKGPIQAMFLDRASSHGASIEASRIMVIKYDLAPGGAFPWHQHPGAVWAVVTKGTLTLYDASCEPQPYPAGSVFLDPGNRTHTARNETAEPVEVIGTFMLPANAAGPSVPVAAPEGCS